MVLVFQVLTSCLVFLVFPCWSTWSSTIIGNFFSCSPGSRIARTAPNTPTNCPAGSRCPLTAAVRAVDQQPAGLSSTPAGIPGTQGTPGYRSTREFLKLS